MRKDLVVALGAGPEIHMATFAWNRKPGVACMDQPCNA